MQCTAHRNRRLLTERTAWSQAPLQETNNKQKIYRPLNIQQITYSLACYVQWYFGGRLCRASHVLYK